MLFPIGDDDRNLSGPAYVTTGLILANLFVFFILQQAGGDAVFTYGWSVVPAEITSGTDLVGSRLIVVGGEQVQIPQAPGPSPIYWTLLSAMFMHGGFLHLFGNLLYLWIFGDNVEHRFGSLTFLVFYLVSGLVATIVQVALDPDSLIPNLGASGAISGVLGAYLVLFPRNKVHAVVFFFIVSVPAVVAIGFWILFQFIDGFGAIVVSEEMAGGVAYGAHIGGFFAGGVMAFVLRVMIKEEPAHIFRDVPDTYRPWRYR
ncbi:MAG: rhomboid family intramembrane serine protease [Rhodothermales bacterium]